MFIEAKTKQLLPTAIFALIAFAALVWVAMIMVVPNSCQNGVFFCHGKENFYYDFFTNKAVSKMSKPYVEIAKSNMIEMCNVRRQDQCYPALVNYWVGLFPETIVGAISCTLIGVVVFLFGLTAFVSRYVPDKCLISVAVTCCSVPFLLAATVANLILYAVGFALIYLSWYDSSSTRRKCIAAIALALATVLKISPVLLGLLYLGQGWRDRIKYAIFSAVVAFVLLVVPFAFCGGVEAFSAWLDNASMNSSLYACRNCFGLYGFVIGLAQCVTFEPLPSSMLQILRIATSCLGIIVLVFGCVSKGGSWERGAAAAIGMLFIPPTMMPYTSLFLIPFAITGMFHEDSRIRKISAIYCLFRCMPFQLSLWLGPPGSLNRCFATAASIDLAFGLLFISSKLARGAERVNNG